MKEFQSYIDSILKHIDATKQEKRELAMEFYDHLLLIKSEKIEEGYSEKDAIQLAIKEFGHSSDLSPLLQKSMNPFYKWKKRFLWGTFIIYILGYIGLFVYASIQRYTAAKMSGLPFPNQYGFNLNPFYELWNYYDRYGLEFLIHIVTVMLLTTLLIKTPLGFLLPLLFKKARSLKGCTWIGLLILESIQILNFILTKGIFGTNTLLWNFIGLAVGYLLWKLTDWLINYLNKKKEPLYPVKG